ncbi:MAG: ABC transporter substrate-binding protein [Deltaproteobacteria bacterium]|nr:ABC transporter substrate-binding protein [Deltaproteobacteria bacterium]
MKLTTKTCILSIVISILIFNTPSFAYDIIIIKGRDIPPYREAVKGFNSVLKANVHEYVIEPEFNDEGKGHAIIRGLKNHKTDLIFTLGSDALALVEGEFRDTPIVFSFVLNPDAVIGAGGGSRRTNIIGIDMNIPPEEQFNAIMKIVPNVQRIAVIYDPSKTQPLIIEAEAAAKKLGITLAAKKIATKAEAINAISQMEGKADAIWMAPDATAIIPESIEYMLLFSFRNKIPIIGISEKYVKNGALLALSFDSEDMGRQAGEAAAAMILEGLENRDIKNAPLLKPRKFRLSINLNTAEKMGINIPEKIIRQSDKVYR